MHKRQYLAAARFFFGALALSAIIYQYVYGMGNNLGFSGWNFISFFTIQSNLLAGVLFMFLGILAWRGHQLGRLHMIRGAATLYMTMTGVIYILLLSGLQESLQTTVPWVNFVLHYLMPLVIVVDWFVDTPRAKLSFRQALPWVVYPLVYVVYSLVRGAMTHWYPYPFLNPAQHGYIGVAATAAIIAPAVLAFVSVLAWSTRRKNMARA